VRKPVPGKLSFNYERDWISYGVKPEQIGAELARDLACQRRRDLPPILKGESDEQLREIRKVYKEVGELAFFDSRLTNMNKAGFTRLIVAVSINVGYSMDKLADMETVAVRCSQPAPGKLPQ